MRPRLLVVGAAAAVLFFGSWMVLPLAAWAPLWALVMIGLLVAASVFDLGEGGEDR